MEDVLSREVKTMKARINILEGALRGVASIFAETATPAQLEALDDLARARNKAVDSLYENGEAE